MKNIKQKILFNILFEKIKIYGKMIKFSHSLFALPFALSAIVLVSYNYTISFFKIFFIIVAMIFARSAAMGFNRVVDREKDAKNPRVKTREIPTGKIDLKSAWLFIIISSLIFFLSAYMLGKLPFYGSFVVLFFLFSYSYTKKFTHFSHIYLGFVISLAPICVWVAITNSISFGIVFLSVALMTYIAGFDILYACQDFEFDKKEGLFSMPVKFGIKKSMRISYLLHIISFISFLLLSLFFPLSTIYKVTVLIIGILFIAEHIIVTPNNFKNINIAFFHINSAISVILFIGIFFDRLL